MFLITIYCPTCNRSSDDTRFAGNFCEVCVIEKLQRNFPERITILQCRFCQRVKEGKTFFPLTKLSLSRIMEIELKLKCKIKVREFSEKEVTADFIYDVDGQKVSFGRTLILKIAHETCRRCYQIKSGYYEAVVQLRGNRVKIERLTSMLTAFIEKNGGFIAKVEKEENGEDVYTSDKLATHEFMHLHKLKPIRSYRLYGVKNGRQVYRNTFSLHL